MYIKTVKTLKKELAKIEKNLSEHQESCAICNYPASCEEEEIECDGFNFIYSEYESKIHEIEVAEQCFQQELKDRNIFLSTPPTDRSNSVIVHITQN
jgi:esterase/lipase